MRSVTIAPAAVFDIADAVTAYEATRPGVGESFLREVLRSRIDLELWADTLREEQPGLRGAFLHGFPYGVFYRLLPGEIQIIAVMPATRAAPLPTD